MSKDHFRARQLISQGRHSEALPLLRQARAESPWSGAIAHDLAMTLTRLDRANEATEVAEQMIAEDADDAFAHATLGLVQLRRGSAREGQESFARALALSPEDASIHGLLARAHLERDQPAEALAATDSGLAIEPDNDLCLTFRAQALLALGRVDESRAVSDRLLELDPDDSHNHALRGYELIHSGRPAEALPHFREALRLDPADDSARLGLSTALKARSPIFAAILRGLIASERLGLWTSLGLLVAFLFGLRLLEKSLADDPVWLPVLAAGKILVYTLFGIVVVAHQLYDVLLSFDPDGRLALSENERRATRWYIPTFTAILLCLWWGASLENPRTPFGMAIGFLFIIRLIAEMFEATPGYVRKRMTWITIGTIIFNVLTPVLKILLLVIALKTESKPLIMIALMLGLVPASVGCFAENIRGWLERRRPDAE